jgi:iron complex outermembrane receptor protein/hemoglobin/transferrin/lactoferrin receptor protein
MRRAALFGFGVLTTSLAWAAEEPDLPLLEVRVIGTRLSDPTDLPGERAVSQVSAADLALRLPQSAPEALHFEPGAFVQQTAHAQGSAFIRGLTGQQTVLLFDGIRLNNSTFRQGPNQYFFTLDTQTIDSIELLRGSASTRYGSDAIGGVVMARPRQPRGQQTADSVWQVVPRLFLRGTTADKERGGRAEFDLSVGPRLGFLGGVGGRRIGLLKGGGVVGSLVDGSPAMVPRLAPDGRTQLGTGFDELTFDGRLVWRASPWQTVTLAAYGYRQYDAPRTDQCAPPFARYDECLIYREQFRTLVYAVWEAHLSSHVETMRTTLSWQRHHELRDGDRPASFVSNRGRDDVNTLGVTLIAESRSYNPTSALRLRFIYGADSYVDWLTSRAWVTFTDLDYTAQRSRGQYLDGARYLYGGTYFEAKGIVWRRLILRTGARLAWAAADAPGDTDSDSLAIHRWWFPLVGHAGLEGRIGGGFGLFFTADHSFRAPNLDDLTSRQQTGPGFQFENADLNPERATSIEFGVRFRTAPVKVDLWAFRSLLHGLIVKQPRDVADCPADTPQCNSSWNRFQLINSRSRSELLGLEGQASLEVKTISLRTTLAWVWGEGPNPAEPPTNPNLAYEQRVPLSRLPPLNGTVELRIPALDGLVAGAALRWATKQNRLAVADRADARIPLGGTPGFAVFDLRASYHLKKTAAVSIIFDNVLNAAYRYHGSSVNGRGRGLMVALEWTPLLER